MTLSREKENFFVHFNIEPEGTDEYSIETEFELKIISANGRNMREKLEYTFKSSDDNSGFGVDFMSWKTMENEYLVDGKLRVEAHVKILKMSGIAKFR